MAAPLNILCVDDDDSILAIIELSLGLDEDMVVRTAGNGSEALALLTNAGWMPDGILLDARMPGQGGRELFGAIRTLPRFAETPVIFLTASINQREMSEFASLSARDVIAKPFDPMTLAAKVRKLLEQ